MNQDNSFRYTFYDMNNSKNFIIRQVRINKDRLIEDIKREFKNIKKSKNPCVHLVLDKKNNLKGLLIIEQELKDITDSSYWGNVIVDLGG